MKIKSNFAVLGSLLLASVSANAATVMFSSGVYADAGISTNGDLIGAINLGGANATVNLVDFIGVSAAASDSTVALASGVSVDIFGAQGETSANGSGSVGQAGALTLNTVFDNDQPNGGDLTFTGLTDGYTYELQLVFSDTRTGVLGATSISLWSTIDQPATAAEHTTADISTAQLVTGTFVADGTTQSVYTQQNTALVGDFDGGAAAFQLRLIAVPEPSSTALLGLGGLALILRRRK